MIASYHDNFIVKIDATSHKEVTGRVIVLKLLVGGASEKKIATKDVFSYG